MGNVRHNALRCVKCYKTNERQYLLSDRETSKILWRNVEVVGEKGSRAVCKCLTCGHTYISDSKPARHALRWLKNHGKL